MIYSTLTPYNTNVWIKNIDKVIKLNELLLDKSRDRHKFMDDEYTKKYRSTFLGKFWYSSKGCYLAWNGKIYENDDSVFSFMFSLDKMTPFTAAEIKSESHTDDYFYKKRDDYKMTQQRWKIYADQPFKIEEKDVIYYQKLLEFHNKSIEIAKGIGIDYEAFNLDEYRQNR